MARACLNRQGTDRLFGDGQFLRPRVKPGCWPFPLTSGWRTESRLPSGAQYRANRDQWHTMTRTSLASRLNQHIDEPFARSIPPMRRPRPFKTMTWFEVSTLTRTFHPSALSTIRPGNLFAPMHWTATNSARGRYGPLVNAVVEPTLVNLKANTPRQM